MSTTIDSTTLYIIIGASILGLALIGGLIALIIHKCKKNKKKHPKLVWAYGGADGSHAVEDPNAQIGNFAQNHDGMSYSWVKGNMEGWGYSFKDASAYACTFYQGKDGKWYGGKFEWISTSRTTRSFENLNGGYKGWDANAYHSAKKHGFLIMSKDCAHRTNFITD